MAAFKNRRLRIGTPFRLDDIIQSDKKIVVAAAHRNGAFDTIVIPRRPGVAAVLTCRERESMSARASPSFSPAPGGAAPAMAELSLEEARLSFADRVLLDGVTLRIDRDERIGLLGRNGCGKTTLMKALAGEIELEAGELTRRQGVRVARLVQELPENLSGTVRDVVAAAADDTQDPSDPDHEQAARVERALSTLSLDGDHAVDALSTGNQRRVLLARALAADPDVLLLDEPTNHLDIDSIRALEDLLARRRGALLFVTHDRVFLQRLATRILDLDRGRLRSYACDYTTYLDRRAADLEAEAVHEAAFDKKLAQEEAWVRRGIKARRTRNEGRVRALEAMRRERADRPVRTGVVRAGVHEADRSGRVVLRADKAGFAYDDHNVFRGFSTEIQRGDRVGIVGANGSGKTTLLRVLLGELEPTEGQITHGTNLQIASFDQRHASLDPDKTVQENVLPHGEHLDLGGSRRHVMGYLQDFLFTPDQIRGSITQLSGGERNRLQLARLLARPCNVLVLDEPTNDLDLETLEILESWLADFDGTLLLVTHDRAFLDNTVTSTIVLPGDGTVSEQVGGTNAALAALYESSGKDSTKTKGSSGDGSKKKPRTKSKERRLSFKEKKELDALPERIESLEESKNELVEAMSEPDFFKRAGDAITKDTARLEALDAELTEAYARWDELDAIASGRGDSPAT